MSRFRWFVVVAATFGLLAWTGLRALESKYPPAPDLGGFGDYSQIEPGLYMGGSVTKPPPGTKCVLNLCEYDDPYKCEHHYWNAIPDSDAAPGIDWLRKQVEIVEKHRKKGDPVYVHCLAGISRSGMVTAAYLMQKNNWTRDQAIEFIRKSRPVANPNPAFMERLLEWEKRAK